MKNLIKIRFKLKVNDVVIDLVKHVNTEMSEVDLVGAIVSDMEVSAVQVPIDESQLGIPQLERPTVIDIEELEVLVKKKYSRSDD